MSSFPSYETLSALLLVGLLGIAIGSSWGRRRERAEADRQADQEAHRALRETSLWHQKAQAQYGLHQGPEDATPDERTRA